MRLANACLAMTLACSLLAGGCAQQDVKMPARTTAPSTPPPMAAQPVAAPAAPVAAPAAPVAAPAAVQRPLENVDLAGKPLTEFGVIVAMLGCRADMPCPQRTRGIGPAAAVSAAALAQTPTATNFDQIQFEFDSDRLTPGARSALGVIAGALKDPALLDRPFVIEGHTDAKGSRDYNVRLSQRRADSVKRYLTETFKLDPQRFRTAGRGPDALADKANPESGVNRRVVFVRM